DESRTCLPDTGHQKKNRSQQTQLDEIVAILVRERQVQRWEHQLKKVRASVRRPHKTDDFPVLALQGAGIGHGIESCGCHHVSACQDGLTAWDPVWGHPPCCGFPARRDSGNSTWTTPSGWQQ